MLKVDMQQNPTVWRQMGRTYRLSVVGMICGLNLLVGIGPTIAAPTVRSSAKPKPIDTQVCDQQDLPRLPLARSAAIPFPAPALRYFPTLLGKPVAQHFYQRSFDGNSNTEKIEALNRAIALAPNYSNAYFRRSGLYQGQQNWAAAIADLQRSYQLNPQNINLLGEQGLLYGNLQNWEKLIGVYQRLIQLDRENADHYYTIVARAHGELQQWPQMIAAYTQAIGLMPQDDPTSSLVKPIPARTFIQKTPEFVTQLPGSQIYSTARLYLYRGYAAARQNHLQQAHADYDRAFQLVQKQGRWSVAELYRERCRLKVRSGDQAGAIADVRLAEQQEQQLRRDLGPVPKFIPIIAPPKAVQLPRISAKPASLPIRYSPSAIVPLSKSAANPSAKPSVKPNVVLPPVQVQSTETAQQSIDRALDFWVGLRYAEGRSISDAEAQTLALGYLDQAIKMQPDLAPAYYHRGVVRSVLEQEALAIANFDRALELNPEFSLAHLGRAQVFFQRNQLDAALAALDRALELDPTLVTAKLMRGQIWLKQGDDRAEAAFDQVLELDPESTIALIERSKLRKARRDLVGSLADERRAAAVENRWHPQQLKLPVPLQIAPKARPVINPLPKLPTQQQLPPLAPR